MNPRGKYNLNFIDWENEMDAVLEADFDENDPQESPIYGMDIETFKAITVSIFLIFISLGTRRLLSKEIWS